VSRETGIQWTDATWNPIRGCSRVSEGCRHCYAEVVAARFSGPGQPYEGLARRTSKGEARWTGKIMFVEKHLEDPLRWKKPARIFVNSMSDLFHEEVTDEQLDRIFAVMALADRHTFQVLTKRPERMLKYFSYEYRWAMIEGASQALYAKRTGEDPSMWLAVNGPLPNVWLGVSVEHQEAANLRIPILADTPAAARFLSCEPLLGSIRLASFFARGVHPGEAKWRTTPSPIAWVIVGGESGAHARPCNSQWIRDIVSQCRAQGVIPFVKQLGAKPGFTLEDEERRGNTMPSYHHYDAEVGLYIKKMDHDHGGDPAEWPEDLRVQEFPRPHPREAVLA